MDRNAALVVLVAVSLARTLPAAAQGYPAPGADAVSDLAGVLDPLEEDSVRAVLGRLRAETGVDARVLTVGSRTRYRTGDRDLQQFANRLMDAWEVGDMTRKDGALLVVAVEDREVWIALGARYGADYDRRMQRVVDDALIPRFREGRFGAGVVAGVRGMARVLGGSGGLAPAAAPGFSTLPAEHPNPEGAADIQPGALSGPAGFQPVNGGTPAESRGSGIPPWLAGVLGLLGLGGAGYLASRPRKCRDCRVPMSLLDEAADDVFLDSGQKVEEYLRSVDYRVWRCGTCNRHDIVRSAALLSGVRECARCRYRTARVERTTLEPATYHSTGRERIRKACAHCGHVAEEIVVLPRLIPPEERSSSASGPGAGSPSSWGGTSSGSRSSGGSSSGSRSSGRGAGGRW